MVAPRQSGFSLIELIVVLLIMSTMMAISAPRLTGRSESAQLRATAADVQALGVAARSKAILRNRSVALFIDPDVQRLQLSLADEFGSDPQNAARLSRARQVADGLSVAIEAGKAGHIVFSPDGSASAGTVRIENTRGLSLTLAVTVPLGRLDLVDES